ncbi:PH domain-containing protein [Leekyejoonella antrihumi]|uniref:YdbS-like PH domain-containing protein n=1 Tax=Leekyejoonella antrihumi TaxID=1660198 RepID=A0A563E809_9MICO|nr:PH domain-containing protein [Leekyejoonella antrihumi]TWP38647.1 hypothetical protein FGL98_02370 [Leekyejoonella antrihumi]
MELRDPANLVSSRARTYWATQYGVLGVILLAAATAGSSVGRLTGEWRWLAFLAVALVLVVGVGVIPIWRYRVHRWEVTSTAIYTKRGWIVQELRIAPLSRVQTVDTERGPIAQLFKLSTVTVTTASAKGEMKIEGLDRETADRVVQELTAATATGADDAT